MIRKIKTRIESEEEQILFFNETDKLARVVFLYGPNGVGKTTLINGIINKTLDITSNKDYDIISYINSKNNMRFNAPDPLGNSMDYTRSLVDKCRAIDLSEGQSIIYSSLTLFEDIEDLPYRDDKNYVILLDEIDSGLSIDNITFISGIINDIIGNRKDIQFIISFNNYHFAHLFGKQPVFLDMYTGKNTTISDYKDFIKFFEDNHDKFHKKRKGNALTGVIE